MFALRTDVALVPLTLAHAERMSRWMLDPAVAEGIGLRDPEPTLAKTVQWLERARHDPSIQPWAIALDGEHVGNLILDRIDNYLGSARLSIYIGEAAARGHGIGATAVHLGVQRGFGELALHKIWLTVHVENAAALAAYVRIGFQLEGVHRDEFLLRGRRLAVCYLGLLKDDFLRCQEAATS